MRFQRDVWLNEHKIDICPYIRHYGCTIWLSMSDLRQNKERVERLVL